MWLRAQDIGSVPGVVKLRCCVHAFVEVYVVNLVLEIFVALAWCVIREGVYLGSRVCSGPLTVQ